MSQTANSVFSSEVTQTDVRLTPAAEAKMAELLESAEAGLNAIRVFVAGGGCGGMTYAMTYAEKPTDYDCTLEGSGYKLLIDAVALNFLQGSEIDFEQDSFIFNNVFQAVGGSGMCGGCMGGGAY
ncbi:MAG: HesB/IscA family protein [Acidiferrobacterales bacterium]